ncbi:hypothetical protein HDU83_003312 [Entophlyctis luteolus]|nr:hypothetical protein HDU83_003312 [Entophlyctis luteolus]
MSNNNAEPHIPPFTEVLIVYLSLVVLQFLVSIERLAARPMLPTILTGFSGLNYVSWISYLFFIVQLASRPFYGRICDLFGRKWPLVASILIYALGAGLTASSQSWQQFIAYRAVEYLGAGGINNSFYIIIADMVPLKSRGQYEAYVNIAFIFTAAAAPSLGAAALAGNWRMLFLATAVIAVVFALLFAWKLSTAFHFVQSEKHTPSFRSIDFIGIIISIAASAVLGLGLQLGGTTGLSWNSAPIVSYLVCGCLLLVLFFAYEYFFADKVVRKLSNISDNGQYAIMTPKLFKNRNVYIYVSGVSSSVSGYINYAETVGAVVTGVGISWIVANAVKWTGNILMGARLKTTSTLAELCFQQVLFGFGAGAVDLVYVLTVQAAVAIEDVAVILGAYFFFRALGGAIGTATMTAIYNTELSNAIAIHLPNANSTVVAAVVSKGPSAVGSNSTTLARLAYQDTASVLYYTSAGFIVAAIMAALFLAPISLQDAKEEDVPAEGAKV